MSSRASAVRDGSASRNYPRAEKGDDGLSPAPTTCTRFRTASHDRNERSTPLTASRTASRTSASACRVSCRYAKEMGAAAAIDARFGSAGGAGAGQEGDGRSGARKLGVVDETRVRRPNLAFGRLFETHLFSPARHCSLL